MARPAAYERLVAQLIATPAPRLAFHNHIVDEQAVLLKDILEDPAVRAHYSDRCVLVSCEDAASAEVVIACVASALGLELSEDAIDTVLEDLATHGRTLIVLENVDAIYSSADAVQQEATDVLLASLAAVDELTLVITFCGTSLPECVAWTKMDDVARNFESQASNIRQHATTPAVVSLMSHIEILY